MGLGVLMVFVGFADWCLTVWVGVVDFGVCGLALCLCEVCLCGLVICFGLSWVGWGLGI